MKYSRIKLTNTDKLTLISNLSTMISAGIPILGSIESLLEDSKGPMNTILEETRKNLLQGKHLYSSFEMFPAVFDTVTVNIIRGAEEAGQLTTALKDLRDQIKKDIEFNDKVRAALMYPVMVLIVLIGILLLILIVAVPKIASVFSRLNVVLPLPTRILIYISHIMLTYTIPFSISIAVICVAFIVLYKEKKQALLSLFYPLPVLSSLIKEIDLTRFSRSMYLLLSSGINITTALKLTEDIVMNTHISKAIERARKAIASGEDLSVVFKRHKNIFPSVMIKIIEAGEKTGTLDNSMKDISEYFEYRVGNTLRALTTVLEPVMLVFVGMLVGGIMLAIIAPIYNLIGQVSPR